MKTSFKFILLGIILFIVVLSFFTIIRNSSKDSIIDQSVERQAKIAFGQQYVLSLNKNSEEKCDGDITFIYYSKTLKERPSEFAIATTWKQGHPQYSDFCSKAEKASKINKEFDEIKKSDCMNIDYENNNGYVNLKESVCISIDTDDDGTAGDAFYIVRIDSYNEEKAEYTFTYKRLS